MRKSTRKTVENENAVNAVNEAVSVVVAENSTSLENAISEVNAINNSEYNAQDVPGDVETVAKIDESGKEIKTAKRKYTRRGESVKAQHERLTVEKMPEKIFYYASIPENISAIDIENRRALLTSIVEENKKYISIWQGCIEFIMAAAGGTFERKAEYIRIYKPNLDIILAENKKAKNMLLDTYSNLSQDSINAMQNAIDTAKEKEDKNRVEFILGYARKNILDYIVLCSAYSYLLPLLIFAGLNEIVLENVSSSDRQILRENGFKYVDDYILNCRDIPGVGRCGHVDGQLYRKQ